MAAGSGTKNLSPTTTGGAYGIVYAAAIRHGVPPLILVGVWGKESNFSHGQTANSGSGPNGGAKGPFQFEDATWRGFGHGNVQNLNDAADGAANYLAYLHRTRGSWAAAIVGYGGGYSLSDVENKAHELDLHVGKGTINAPSIVPGIGDAVGKDLGGINSVINPSGDGKPVLQLQDILGGLIKPEIWMRIAQVVAGLVLAFLALKYLLNTNKV